MLIHTIFLSTVCCVCVLKGPCKWYTWNKDFSQKGDTIDEDVIDSIFDAEIYPGRLSGLCVFVVC